MTKSEVQWPALRRGINYWTRKDVLCNQCDGMGFEYDLNDVAIPCPGCVRTGLEAVPWTELFPARRLEER